ncbi:MAG: trypsin-like peptidase domain-containing protein [Candidatus Levybacteria bacterium]|nr:trypsin-like peptidase domain-containing protein [Candidatus Levybacteria bacterium]
MRRLIALIVFLLVILGAFGILVDRFPNIFNSENAIVSQRNIELLKEESVVIDTVKKTGPSVITIVEDLPPQENNSLNLGPFSIFGLQDEEIDPKPRNIGSGFIVSSEGLVVTNKHVVSDRESKYQILMGNDTRYTVQRIYRDPLNDLAILKINPSEHPQNDLEPLVLGDSDSLRVGQFVIAIGTALGQFPNTVTTGVISGLGRGIVAGSSFQGFTERLDNVIQTDAAINPGNSGGPLLNSSGQVIGVNSAVAASGQNIGFAIPVNILKDSIDSFNKGGQFDRPYLGVSYRMLDKDLASLNNLPEGAYIETIITSSPADKAGLKPADVIISIDGVKMEAGKNELAKIISEKKVGAEVSISYWREGNTAEVKVILEKTPEQ